MERLQEWKRWHWLLAIGLLAFSGWGLSQVVASFSKPSEELLAQGQDLFEHEWQPNDPLAAEGDGLGPVFNARSCVACHFQGGVGGAGQNQHNVTAFMALPNPKAGESEVVAGVVHKDAVLDQFRESMDIVRSKFPIIKGLRTEIDGCVYQEPDFNPLIVASVNTPAIFGAGQIDRIPDSTIRNSRRWNLLSQIGQELQGKFDSIPAGRVRILPDGRVGKFGWKGQFASVEDFVAAACAVEIGLTNPKRAQDKPHQQGSDDHAKLDLDRRQFRALVAFCESLPAPILESPESPELKQSIARGQELFSSIGCAVCHVPDVADVKGVYSDFLLYSLEDRDSDNYTIVPSEIPLPSSEPRPNEWKTPPLWGVADSAPYMHDGRASTLMDAILQHNGDARTVKEKFGKLNNEDQQSVLAFLRALKAPSDVPAVKSPPQPVKLAGGNRR
ncbi:MAG TPA: di-heme oxidoredictase family protein [Planctomycetaceae bacterium]|nr:di-heme oxidoredictase family protein [Planctomycetaceae bacterium]